jgi:GxxExxY protein
VAPSTLQDPETHVVIGASMKVHRVMGCGFVEPVYHAAMKIELRRLQVPFASEVGFELQYDGEPLNLCYRADLVCFKTLIVEVKALSGIGPLEEAQAINYLKASRLRRALIVNFGARSLQWRRLVL